MSSVPSVEPSLPITPKRKFTLRRVFAQFFSVCFFILAAAIMGSMAVGLVNDFQSDASIMQILISTINSAIISLAVFELGMVIDKEYGDQEEQLHSHGNQTKAADWDAVGTLRRTLPRFIGTVCVALSLEGLIMVIKYSQLDLAGNLYYPVAIITSAAFLLIALGIFLYFIRK